MSNKLINLSRLQDFKTNSDLKYQDKLTAGSNISIANNVISATTGGVTYSSPPLSTTSIANNTIVKVGEVTLQPGKYILSYTCAFARNSSGYRQCGFSLNTTDITGFGRNWGDFKRAASSDLLTQTHVCGTFEVSANDYPNGQTFYFLAKQNSGSAINAVPRCYFVKF